MIHYWDHKDENGKPIAFNPPMFYFGDVKTWLQKKRNDDTLMGDVFWNWFLETCAGGPGVKHRICYIPFDGGFRDDADTPDEVKRTLIALEEEFGGQPGTDADTITVFVFW